MQLAHRLINIALFQKENKPFLWAVPNVEVETFYTVCSFNI
ncbi:hypothetical protein KIS1582_2966 [Cytobacillus firmus]|uniref:Uncharacterized protein n=1 Tax=Cytobacillus firmus TaxID=1399 RepID=A0A800MVV5_CYTFI|nr:hypothetical protein KIS1582_2966 [Cytobacillus firmus]